MGTTAHRDWKALAMGACLMMLAPLAWAKENLAPLYAEFALPDDRVDYAETKLVVDHLIDPSTDISAVMRELERWEQAVRTNAPANPTPRGLLDALLKTLYEPGPWNQEHPFTYDLNDPLGQDAKTKQLATYLATRKGNCVSMPILVVILGQRLGLPMALATAPHHVLVKFADEVQQAWLNVEATAGGFKWDSSYERETGITPKAIENELYLRPLLPHEGVGVIASTLMEHYGAQEDGESLLEVSDLALSANPRDPVALVWKANAYYLQLQQRYVLKYPSVADIPSSRVPEFQRLSRENLDFFSKAEQLGWIQKTPEHEATYLQSIQHEKAKRGQ